MPSFEYTGYDGRGKTCKGLTTDASRKEARDRLAQSGILVDTLKPVRAVSSCSGEQRALIYRELGALVKAGMPLDQALALLARSPELGKSRTLLVAVRERVLEGDALAQALASVSASCTPFEIAIVEAAERSATMDSMLARLANFLEAQDQLRENVRSALVYPILVLTFGLCSAIVILGVLMPRLHDTLMAGGARLPWLTRAALALGGLFSQGLFWVGVTVFVVATVISVKRVRRDAERRWAWDRRLFRLPLYGQGYALLVNVRFAGTLSILVSGGVALIDGLVMAGRATGSLWLARLAEAEAEHVRHGKSLADAVRAMGPLSESLPGWIQVGEAGGGMAEVLDHAGQRYQDRWVRFVNRRLHLLEPLLILAMGAFVLLLALAILLPVFSMSGTL